MKKLIIGLAAAIALIACTPTQTHQVLESLVPDPYKGALQLYKDVGSSGPFTKVTFFAGDAVAIDVSLYIGGNQLSVTDSRCKPVNRGIGCELGDIQAGAAYTVNVTGSDISANAFYYRGNSRAPSGVFGRYPIP